jgi:hypothetical protein
MHRKALILRRALQGAPRIDAAASRVGHIPIQMLLRVYIPGDRVRDMDQDRFEGDPMFTSELMHAGHRTRFTITRTEAGWDVREERDSEVIRAVNYTDWHRVERAMQVFKLQRGLDAHGREA